MNLVMLNELSDDAKIVRLVDERGMWHSRGENRAGKLCYSFPLQLLSHCRQCEDISCDPNEGGTIIDFGGNKGSGGVVTVNDALISCWSMCSDPSDPWASLAGSAFVNNPYALVTTIGKVKEQIRKIFLNINNIYRDEYGSLLLNAIYGLVSYYPVKGVPQNEWNKKISDSGIDLPTIQNIFHKPSCNKKGQSYEAEKECRFALIINVRSFKATDNSLINANELAKRLIYPQIHDTNSHYIEQIHVRTNNGNVCYESHDFLRKTEIA